MAAVESGGGFNQKRNTNSQVGYAAGLGSYEIGRLSIARRCPFCVANSAKLARFTRVCCTCAATLLRVVDFLRGAHVTGVENGQVNFAHTGCSHESPALLETLARPIWLASEGVARGVSQFIGQNKVWEGDGWVWGEGKSSPPMLLEKM